MNDREQSGLPGWLKGPVMTAAGVLGEDGFGGGLPEDIPLRELGAVVLKTVTSRARKGNPQPTVAARKGYTLNSVGLRNPGLQALLQDILPGWKDRGTSVIVSIADGEPRELRRMAEALRESPVPAAIEINLSCPNTKGGSLQSQDPELTKAALRAAVAGAAVPVIAKLSPNVADIAPIARAAQQAGASALTLANTMPATLLTEEGDPVLGAEYGGLSGPALFPINLALVRRAWEEVSIPIIGCGGISGPREARIYLAAGASAVQIGTRNLEQPWAAVRTARSLRRGTRPRRTAPGVQQARGTETPDAAVNMLTKEALAQQGGTPEDLEEARPPPAGSALVDLMT